MTTPAEEPTPVARPDTDGSTPDTPETKTPVWWTAVPVLVAAYAVYGLLQGDSGAIWPWGDIAVLVVALVLLGFVLAPRLRAGRRR